MNEKRKEVHGWLERVFVGTNVPNYEITSENIDILTQLMQCNERCDQAAQLLIQDLQQKSEEYHVEAERIGKTLDSLCLSKNNLSESGAASLKTLASVANLLEVKDTTDTSLLLGLIANANTLMELKEERETEQQMISQLFSKTKAALHQYSTLKKALEAVDSDAKQEESELMKKAKEAAYLHSKAKEYKKQIQQKQLELTSNNISPTIYHHNLMKTAKELEELRKTLQPLKAKLDSYHKLPSDLSLARVKVEEAKMELKKMETQLVENMNMLNI